MLLASPDRKVAKVAFTYDIAIILIIMIITLMIHTYEIFCYHPSVVRIRFQIDV